MARGDPSAWWVAIYFGLLTNVLLPATDTLALIILEWCGVA